MYRIGIEAFNNIMEIILNVKNAKKRIDKFAILDYYKY